MMCVEIMRNNCMISTQEWIYLIRGASAIDRQRPEKPNVFWLSEEVNFNY